MFDFFKATIDLFTPHLGQSFLLHLEEGDIPFTLVETSLLPKRKLPVSTRIAPRDSFSLVWRGPESRFLPQGQYDLSHTDPEIGRIDGLFLTPIGKDGDGYLYQSIFN